MVKIIRIFFIILNGAVPRIAQTACKRLEEIAWAYLNFQMAILAQNFGCSDVAEKCMFAKNIYQQLLKRRGEKYVGIFSNIQKSFHQHALTFLSSRSW